LLTICAAIAFGIAILNPLKFDWQQRIALLIAISAFAYFLARTVHKPKASSSVTAIAPDPRIGSLEQEVSNLRSQQQKLLDQQSVAEEETKNLALNMFPVFAAAQVCLFPQLL
jgi:hypothetical protein